MVQLCIYYIKFHVLYIYLFIFCANAFEVIPKKIKKTTLTEKLSCLSCVPLCI